MKVNMNPYTHLIWDWNGTLLDDSWLCVDIMNNLLQKRNKAAITPEQYRQVFDFPIKTYYQRVGFDFSSEPFEHLATEFIVEYDRRWHECKLQPNAMEVLNWCNNKGNKQYILSASQQLVLQDRITHYELDEHFTRLVGLSDHYANGKVDCGRQLVSEFNVPAEEILLIGDTVHDYEVAQALGIDCILFTGGHQPIEKLKMCETVVIENLSAVPPIVSSQ